MKIAVWKTGHEIADTVAEAIYQGLRLPVRYGKCTVDLLSTEMKYHSNVIETPDIHIGYGILRGIDEVFCACDKAGKPWFNIDKGYWKPRHYDGYYRVSLRGTQQTTGLDKLAPDYARWDALGIEIDNGRIRDMLPPLICPPTEHVKNFFGITEWYVSSDHGVTRPKDCIEPLQNDLNRCGRIVTFNSSVGWEALRQGIPVVSDPQHSIVGAWQKTLVNNQYLDYDERRRLFSIMAGLQLTLEEIRQGLLWPLIEKLLSDA